ncbi:MAG: DUF2889 domain-containing protein [Rhodospirillaceae bacterium]|nr:DUF2889 domain-containing protein [Rhodospirillaceae bacterium]
MPLSAPAQRDHIHTRTVECRGYRREDGLWDIEGHLVDVKSYPFPNAFRGTIEAGEPLHDMWLRLTVTDQLEIVRSEAVIDHHPYDICPLIAPNFKRLEGLKIGPGFTRKVKTLLGGVQGCTHLVELVGPVATTAFQTVYPILARQRGELPHTHGRAESRHRPSLLNSCHAYAEDGEVVRRHWPDHYTGSRSTVEAAE